jgi:mannan endo-1,6-alpha-mannosidase
MGALVDYWYYTGDTKYNNITEQALLFQVGPYNDYMPPNQTLTEGNDDQGFWGMAVMSAAEYNFPNPPADKPQWLALAQAVFNTQADRWEPEDCGGGLRWQIFRWNNGFDYKNSISQACFFNLAARLALYTGNASYAAWADRTWDWMMSSKLINNSTYYVYDGTHIENCSEITPYQWTYNAGGFLIGAAAMYNYTNGSTRELWRERTEGLLNGTMVFFTGNNSDIMTEVACEPVNLCDVDQQSFKAYLSRWMAVTTKWAPFLYSRIKPLLASSAVAAAAQCTGGANGRMCGLRWTDDGVWDKSTGVGQQMAAMEVVLANLIHETTSPVTNTTGGTSVGDPGAGGSDIGRTDPATVLNNFPPVTTAGRAGAAISTAAVIIALFAAIVFMMIDETVERTPAERFADLRSSAAGGGAALFRHLQKGQAESKGKEVERPDMLGDVPAAEKAVVIETKTILEKDFAKGAGGQPPPIQEFWTPSGTPTPIPPVPVPPAVLRKSLIPLHQRHRSMMVEPSSGYAHWADDANEDSSNNNDDSDVSDNNMAALRAQRLSYPPAPQLQKRGTLQKKKKKEEGVRNATNQLDLDA